MKLKFGAEEQTFGQLFQAIFHLVSLQGQKPRISPLSNLNTGNCPAGSPASNYQ